ncbi:MAG: electron transport complex subunit E [Desulfarculus sp.]|nr:electron transport complex subunit E [Desulfarculus sp.]
MSLMKEFTKGFWELLPPFRLVLGLCPTLAVTTSAENGLGMGLATAFVLACSNMLISALRKIIPSKVRIAAFIVVVATFVVVVELTMQAYFYALYVKLGIFIPLIVVNCIPLGRAEAFASSNGVLASGADGLGIGLGFAISLFSLGTIREIFGAGTFWGVHVMWSGYEPMAFLLKAPGAFVCLGLMLAAINLISARQAKRKLEAARLAAAQA